MSCPIVCLAKIKVFDFFLKNIIFVLHVQTICNYYLQFSKKLSKKNNEILMITFKIIWTKMAL